MPAPMTEVLYTVEPGDSLWSIAERVLIDRTGAESTDGEIADYWASVIDANRDRLVDPDNPDLILPGQVMLVPQL